MNILMSIRPKWVELILSGKKTIEVRKTRPKIETPFKVHIYCTNSPPYLVYGDRFNGQSFVDGYYTVKGYSREQADKIWGVLNGKVIGEFVCDLIEWNSPSALCVREDAEKATRGACISIYELKEYLKKAEEADSIYEKYSAFYCWHISDLKIYDEPKELSEFSKHGFFQRVPINHPPQSWMLVEE